MSRLREMTQHKESSKHSNVESPLSPTLESATTDLSFSTRIQGTLMFNPYCREVAPSREIGGKELWRSEGQELKRQRPI